MSTSSHAVHTTVDHAHAEGHGHAHELGFWKKYIFSTDHKIIGIQFLLVGLMFFVLGGLLAMLVRWQLAYPDAAGHKAHPVPILGRFLFLTFDKTEKAGSVISVDAENRTVTVGNVSDPSTLKSDLKAGDVEAMADSAGARNAALTVSSVADDQFTATWADGTSQADLPKVGDTVLGRRIPGGMDPTFYTMIFSMHATIMIFFVIIPLLVGTFGNYLIPLQIGAADMAFPFLNGMAFWLAIPAGTIIVASFLINSGAARAGWTSYPPLSEIELGSHTVPYVPPQGSWDSLANFLRVQGGTTVHALTAADVDAQAHTATTTYDGEASAIIPALHRAIDDTNARSAKLASAVEAESATTLKGKMNQGGGEYTVTVNPSSAGAGTITINYPDKPDIARTFIAKLTDPVRLKLLEPAWQRPWPAAAMLSVYLGWFLCFLFIGAYYVRLGNRYLSRTVAVAIALVAGYWALQGTEAAVFDGQSGWFASLIILGFSSIMGSVNYLTTIVKLRCPGMTMFRLPLSIWSLFITSILVLLATPVLASALTANLLDHHRITGFFLPFNWLVANHTQNNPGGGYPLLHQHIFWFYSHPAVYIMILPAMGMVSDIIAVGARKPIFGYRPMVYAMAGIAFLGFIVWAHHMFQSGMNPTLGTTFAVSTIFISVPSAIKTFNWLGTLWGGNIRFNTAMCNALSFVAMFIIGGLSGIFMASTAIDVHIHDTYFIVAHIHYVLFGGTMFGVFGAITFWYPKMFGRMMNEKLGMAHFFLTFIFFNLTFFPMHIMGIGGMARRLYDITAYQSFAHFQPMNRFVSHAAFGLGLAQILFAVNFIGSWIWGKKAPDNPWEATTLEWTTHSPPPHGNFATVPVVHHGPYEYSSPLVEEDWLAQTRYVEGAQADPHAGH